MRTRLPVAVLAALATLSCKPSGSTVQPAADPPQVRPRAEPDPSRAVEARPAFVVLSEDSTWVIPIDPAHEVLQLEGHFVGGQPGQAAAAYGRFSAMLTTETDSKEVLPLCASGEFGGECELDLEWGEVGIEGTVLVHADGTQTHSLPCDCAVVVGVSTDGAPEPEFDITDPDMLVDIELSPYTPEEYLTECSEEALEPDLGLTTILAGVVYETGMAHNNICSGLNIYDAAERQTPLRPGAEPLRRDPSNGMMCLPEGDSEWLDPAMASLDEGDCTLGEDDCDCDDVGEMSAFAIRRGELVHITGNITPVATGCACVGREPLTRDNCPSVVSPCGRGQQFEDLVDWPEYWVTTDETLALGVMEGRFGVLTSMGDILRMGEPPDVVLDVEFHRDTALRFALELPTEIRVVIPELHPDDAGFDGSAKAWGNRCFGHLKAGHLDAAEAACIAGLLAGGSDGTRGALTYNLGRVAEERRRPERAVDYYRRSDGLRPGNATVQARLLALSPD